MNVEPEEPVELEAPNENNEHQLNACCGGTSDRRLLQFIASLSISLLVFIKPVTSTSNENGNGVIQTVLDLSGLLDTRIEVRFLQNGTNNVSQIGSTRSVAPSLTIYTIG